MEGLTLDQAARESGRSARELRLAIESGDLVAVQRDGRWWVSPIDLHLLVRPAPPSPPEPPEMADAPPAGGAPDPHPLGELVARLETRAVEVATLREELVQATRRIKELEGECRPSKRQAGMRDALTPLFERTLVPGGPGSAQ